MRVNKSENIYISGLICKNFSYVNSRVSSKSIDSWFNKQKLIAISDVDTRALVRYIRENGAMNAAITTDINNLDKLKKKLMDSPEMEGLELASKVSTKKAYFLGNSKARYRLAVLDLGVKKNILSNFIDRGFYIKVFPYDTNFDELIKFKPNGFFLSNGPGDPKPLEKVIETTKEIIKSNFPFLEFVLDIKS